MRPIYFILGCLFFSIGFVGVFVPVLPTTPFMLLALWGFSRSSLRFHHWLYTHKLFGPPLQQWHNYKVIPPLAKFIALFFISISLIYMVFFLALPLWGYLIISTTMISGLWFIMTKPSYPPEQ